MKIKKSFVFSSIYFTAGIVMVLAVQLTGCSTGKNVQITDLALEEGSSKEKALDWYRQEMLKVNVEGLEAQKQLPEESQNKRVLAEINFNICNDAYSYPYCDEANRLFAEIVQENPDDSQARAYLGASYALKARDYPVQGLWLVIPGPGFVRLYYLFKGAQQMNAAVEADPYDPVVRLIRGSAFLNMPGKSKAGKEDIEQLLAWLDDRSTNPKYANILESEIYAMGVYFSYVTNRNSDGPLLNDEQAYPYWKAIVDKGIEDHPMVKVASVHLTESGQIAN